MWMFNTTESVFLKIDRKIQDFYTYCGHHPSYLFIDPMSFDELISDLNKHLLACNGTTLLFYDMDIRYKGMIIKKLEDYDYCIEVA